MEAGDCRECAGNVQGMCCRCANLRGCDPAQVMHVIVSSKHRVPTLLQQDGFRAAHFNLTVSRRSFVLVGVGILGSQRVVY